MVIAATFLVNPALGMATTVAVAAHEIPHEIADFGILLNSRFSRSTALLLNFLSGLVAVLGAVWCFWFEGMVDRHLSWFIAGTAGMFIYIAASDLMPELHHARDARTWLYAVPFFLGVALIAGDPRAGALRVAASEPQTGKVRRSPDAGSSSTVRARPQDEPAAADLFGWDGQRRTPAARRAGHLRARARRHSLRATSSPSFNRAMTTAVLEQPNSSATRSIPSLTLSGTLTFISLLGTFFRSRSERRRSARIDIPLSLVE